MRERIEPEPQVLERHRRIRESIHGFPREKRIDHSAIFQSIPVFPLQRREDREAALDDCGRNEHAEARLHILEVLGQLVPLGPRVQLRHQAQQIRFGEVFVVVHEARNLYYGFCAKRRGPKQSSHRWDSNQGLHGPYSELARCYV